MNIDHQYILDIKYSHYYVSNQGEIVNSCWNPSYIGIHANNKADKAAKSALEFAVVIWLKYCPYGVTTPSNQSIAFEIVKLKFKVPPTNLKQFIKST